MTKKLGLGEYIGDTGRNGTGKNRMSESSLASQSMSALNEWILATHENDMTVSYWDDNDGFDSLVSCDDESLFTSMIKQEGGFGLHAPNMETSESKLSETVDRLNKTAAANGLEELDIVGIVEKLICQQKDNGDIVGIVEQLMCKDNVEEDAGASEHANVVPCKLLDEAEEMTETEASSWGASKSSSWGASWVEEAEPQEDLEEAKPESLVKDYKEQVFVPGGQPRQKPPQSILRRTTRGSDSVSSVMTSNKSMTSNRGVAPTGQPPLQQKAPQRARRRTSRTPRESNPVSSSIMTSDKSMTSNKSSAGKKHRTRRHSRSAPQMSKTMSEIWKSIPAPADKKEEERIKLHSAKKKKRCFLFGFSSTKKTRYSTARQMVPFFLLYIFGSKKRRYSTTKTHLEDHSGSWPSKEDQKEHSGSPLTIEAPADKVSVDC